MDIERIARMISENIDEIHDDGSDVPMAPVEFANAVNSLLLSLSPEARAKTLQQLYTLGERDKNKLLELLSQQSDSDSSSSKIHSFYQEKTSNIVLLVKLVDLIFNSDDAINDVLDTLDLISGGGEDEDDDLSSSDGYDGGW